MLLKRQEKAKQTILLFKSKLDNFDIFNKNIFMANNKKEIVKVLNVETKGSDVRVKTLRQEIAALNEVLKNTEQGSSEYNAAVQQIKNNQDLLSKAMGATKTEAGALEGSYDALTNKLNELKKAWKATNDEVERSKLANEIKEVKGAITELDNSLGDFKTNSVDSLSKFKEEMGDAQDKIEPFKAKFESIQKISSGVASGFAAVQGAMALMGVENDQLGQTFIKLQAAMAIAQGVGGLGDLVEGMSQAKVAFSGAITSVKAFITSLRGMKLAMAATGIGAALVLVGLLAKAYMDLADATDKAKEAKEKGELDKAERFEKLSNVGFCGKSFGGNINNSLKGLKAFEKIKTIGKTIKRAIISKKRNIAILPAVLLYDFKPILLICVFLLFLSCSPY